MGAAAHRKWGYDMYVLMRNYFYVPVKILFFSDKTLLTILKKKFKHFGVTNTIFFIGIHLFILWPQSTFS